MFSLSIISCKAIFCPLSVDRYGGLLTVKSFLCGKKLASLHGGVNFRANAVFTIFALYLTLVCTFLHQFALSKFVVNPMFRAVYTNNLSKSQVP